MIMTYLLLIFAVAAVLAVFAFAVEAAAKEKAARAITGRLIPQLPTRRRFHRTADFGGAAAPKATAAVPHRRVGWPERLRRRPIPTTRTRLNLKIRPATVT
jgi:hypothetical protein